MAAELGDSSSYLKKSLDEVLAKALHEVCQVRPLDPIEYLAKCLYKATDCELYYQEKAVFAKEMELTANQMKHDDRKRHGVIARNKRHIIELKRIVYKMQRASLPSHSTNDEVSRLRELTMLDNVDGQSEGGARPYMPPGSHGQNEGVSRTYASPGSSVRRVRRASPQGGERRSVVSAAASQQFSPSSSQELSLERSPNIHSSRSETVSSQALARREGRRRSQNWREKPKGRTTTSDDEQSRVQVTDSSTRRAMNKSFKAAKKELSDQAKKDSKQAKQKKMTAYGELDSDEDSSSELAGPKWKPGKGTKTYKQRYSEEPLVDSSDNPDESDEELQIKRDSADRPRKQKKDGSGLKSPKSGRSRSRKGTMGDEKEDTSDSELEDRAGGRKRSKKKGRGQEPTQEKTKKPKKVRHAISAPEEEQEDENKESDSDDDDDDDDDEEEYGSTSPDADRAGRRKRGSSAKDSQSSTGERSNERAKKFRRPLKEKDSASAIVSDDSKEAKKDEVGQKKKLRGKGAPISKQTESGEDDGDAEPKTLAKKKFGMQKPSKLDSDDPGQQAKTFSSLKPSQIDPDDTGQQTKEKRTRKPSQLDPDDTGQQSKEKRTRKASRMDYDDPGQQIKERRTRKPSQLDSDDTGQQSKERKIRKTQSSKPGESTDDENADASKKTRKQSRTGSITEDSLQPMKDSALGRLGGKQKNLTDETSADEQTRPRKRKPKAGKIQETTEETETEAEAETVTKRKRRVRKVSINETDLESEDVGGTTFDASSADETDSDKIKKLGKKKATKKDAKKKPLESTSEPPSMKPSRSLSTVDTASSEMLDTTIAVSLEDSPESYSEVTPMECYWVLHPRRVLVCVHPVLGELLAHSASYSTQDEQTRPRKRKPKAGKIQETTEETETEAEAKTVTKGKRRVRKVSLNETDLESEDVGGTTFDASSADETDSDKIKKLGKKKATKKDAKKKPLESTSEPPSMKPSRSLSTVDTASSEMLDTTIAVSLEDSPESYSEVTPMECYWVLHPRNVLVCVHPVLGELLAHSASYSTQDYTGWPVRKGYTWQAFYDPEVYTVINPYTDDSRLSLRRGLFDGVGGPKSTTSRML